MTRRKKVWLVGGLLAAIVVLAVVLVPRVAGPPAGGEGAGVGEGGVGEGGDSESGVQAEAQVVPVRVTRARPMTITETLTYSGSIEAWEQAQITGPTGQRIDRLHVREGDRVQRGQLVAEMDAANLSQAEVELGLARDEVERLERLVEIGAVARQQYEQAVARLETAQSNVELLRSNTRLTAPIDGVVTATYFVAGEQFVPGAQAPAILTIQQIDPLRVVVDVAERHFPEIEEGMEAAVRVDTYPDREFEGVVEQVTPTIDPASRTFRVEVRLDNDARELSPGMFARVQLSPGEVTGRFLPSAAVQAVPGSDESYVWAVDGGRARRLYLRVGERFEDRVQVLEGLPDDVLVVIEGMGRLREGDAVRVVDEAASGGEPVGSGPPGAEEAPGGDAPESAPAPEGGGAGADR